MHPTQEWLALAAELRTAELRRSHPAAMRRLYALAIALARAIVGKRNPGGHFRDEGSIEADDLVHELFATKLDAILAADAPRAFFATCLKNLQLDHARRRAREASLPAARGDDENARADAIDAIHAAAVTDGAAPVEDTLTRRAAVLRGVEALSERDRDIVLAASFGTDREELARTYGTSRANVDQVLSRFRAHLREVTR